MVEHDVTAFLGVPTMYMALLGVVDADGTDLPLPDLRLCVSGGAPLPVKVLEQFNTTFDVTIQEGYGLSETSPTATVNQLEYGVEAGLDRPPDLGRRGRDRRRRGRRRHRVARRPARPARSSSAATTSSRATTAARRRRRPRSSTAGSAPATSGPRTSAGFIRIVDRKKDLILRGGYNVYPREVEEVLVRHPDVDQVAVVGIPHETHGEEVLAVVVPRDGATIDAEAFLAWAGEHIARHKRPRLVQVVDELPLGPSRKVLKRELRDRFSDAGRVASGPPAAVQDRLQLLQRGVQVRR